MPGDIVEFSVTKVIIGDVVEVEKPPKPPKPPKSAKAQKPKSQVHPARRRNKPTSSSN